MPQSERLPIHITAYFTALAAHSAATLALADGVKFTENGKVISLGDGLWKTGDGAIIDGFGPDGIAAATRELAREASRLQTGYVYHYAFAMLIGVVALVTWYLLPR